MPKKILFFLFLFALLSVQGAHAQTPAIKAVLFYSPTCPHCHKVMDQDLPPLVQKYGAQLEILEVNVTLPAGQQLYQAAVQAFRIPQDRLGVPNLTIGTFYLVGSTEIPTYLPMLIEEGLATGGTDWPVIPGLQNALDAGAFPFFGQSAAAAPKVTIWERFRQDPLANSLAVIVLAGMLYSVSYLWLKVRGKQRQPAPEVPNWTIPGLAVAGLAIAAYLTFIEVYQAEAVCGPIGDCNAVQQSSYAMLFGVIPIGVLGLVGYAVMLGAWFLQRSEKARPPHKVNRYLWIMALAGTVFSMYLTFLEPFVIGSTCAWCLASAVIMTALLWATSLNLVGGRRLRGAV